MVVVVVTSDTGILLVPSEYHEYKALLSSHIVIRQESARWVPFVGALLAICLRPRVGCAPFRITSTI